MKHASLLSRSSVLILSILLFASTLSMGQSARLSAAALKPFGRSAYDQQKGLELIGSAVHFGFSFQGNTCSIDAYVPDENAHGYLQYELDGKYQKRIRISGNSKEPVVLTAAGKGTHRIWIYKATEAHTGPIFIREVRAQNIRALENPVAPLIEFIGNSITCGAASDPSEIACGAGEYHDQHNAYMAYGPRLGRALHVNYMLSSVSGIGIYRNWNSDGPVMPSVYEKTDLQDQSSRYWDFKSYNPVIVSIALGTNDFSNGDGKTPRKPFNPDEFTSRYVQFVKLVKSKYPKAQIALLSSPMVKGKNAEILEGCLTAVKKQIDAAFPSDKAVETFFFASMKPHGCGGHPDVQDHALMAEQLNPFFKKLLASNK
jgi:hypothetical protein